MSYKSRAITLTLSIFLSSLSGQTDIAILSQNVGTEIDQHENRFYRIFPKEKGLVNAQIIRITDQKFRIDIVKEVKNKITKVNRYIDQNDFDQLKKKVDDQPILTEDLITAMYDGMDFLRAEKIINEIPKPQYVILRYSNNKRLNGTLFKVEDNVLYIQTATSIEKVSLDVLDKMSYRESVGDFDSLRPYAFLVTGASGFMMARLYNSQRPVIYNDNGIPRNDIGAYRQIFGTIIGLIFSGEVFDAISTLLTPTETIILSEAEYDKENF